MERGLRRALVTGAALGMLVLAILPTPAVAAISCYVSTTGNDSSGTGTLANPWQTIQHGIDQLSAGSTLYVRGGMYNEIVTISSSGTAGNPKTIKAYTGETAILDGTGLADPGYLVGMILLENASYVTVDGLELRNNPWGHGLLVWSTHGNTGITLMNLNAHHNALGGIVVSAWSQPSPITNVVIDGCDVHHNFNVPGPHGDENISLLNVVGFEIKNNHVHDSYDKEGIDTKNGSMNGTIHDNEVSDSRSPKEDVGIYVDGFDQTQSNISVYNNKVDGWGLGIGGGCETGGYAQLGIHYYSNLVYDNTVGFSATQYGPAYDRTFTCVNNTFVGNAFSIAVDGPAVNNINCVVRNNISVVDSDEQVHIFVQDYDEGGVTVDHNLYYSLDRTYNRLHTYGSNYLLDQNPLFAGTGDYRLRSTSPARDRGSSAAAPSTDILGNARPQGGAYDIGAYEYTATTPPPETTTRPPETMTPPPETDTPPSGATTPPVPGDPGGISGRLVAAVAAGIILATLVAGRVKVAESQ
jgi:hypothetical protein